ncbi:hypothetical protein DRQ25_09885 [Candidatus Fermentibacteria bacterium]|nr:MAG: hypothetical protein DRQ25_09885 [Candidatus Fermentibacteria bacterium]
MSGSIARATYVLIIISLVLSSQASANYAYQFCWSGGDGVSGPVSFWDDSFFSCSNIDYYSSPVGITLYLQTIEHAIDTSFIGVIHAVSSDIDSDGDNDIIGSSLDLGTICWWENQNGSGTSWIKHTVVDDYESPRLIHCADINDDGYLDILCPSYSLQLITWWENVDGTGTDWIRHTIDTWYSSPDCITSGYINDDEYLDVIGESCFGDKITWWENYDGTGINWIEHTIEEYYERPRFVCTGDINNDGYIDVISASTWMRVFSWWNNVDGTGSSWLIDTVGVSSDKPVGVHSEDINNDGYLDIIGTDVNAGLVMWWENSGTPHVSWAAHGIDELDGARYIHSGDITGNGSMDILVTSTDANTVKWWENSDTSPGVIWIPHTVDSDYAGARGAYLDDINGDGNMDILAVARETEEISWWDVISYSSVGTLESSILEVSELPDWQSFEWISSETPGTSIVFQLRSSNDPVNMGPWSDTLYSPCGLEGIISDSTAYFQYKAILSTIHSLSGPNLVSVTVTWDPLGIPVNDSLYFELLPIVPNPARLCPLLRFTIPATSLVEAMVYDCSGKLIDLKCFGLMESGYHECLLGEYLPGVYFCRLNTDRASESRKFIVID